MKRFVTYLYEYERGVKVKSAGFIKVDIRNGICLMEICVRKFFKSTQVGEVYALTQKNGVYGSLLGEIEMSGGQGDLRLQISEREMEERAICVENMVGVGIRFGQKEYIASCWEDAYAKEIAEGQFRFDTKQHRQEIVSEEVISKEIEPEKMVSEEIILEEIILEEIPSDRMQSAPILYSASEQENFVDKPSDEDFILDENTAIPTDEQMQIQAAECEEIQYIYRKMDLMQIRELPQQDRHLGSNAFLIHGFWNYGYLILKTEMAENEKTILLGVPGVYERQEAAMALAFGFPKFEMVPMEMIDAEIGTELHFEEKEINNQPPREKLFGCWFVELHGR